MINTTNENQQDEAVLESPPAAAPQLYTIKQFARACPAFTESSLRNLIFKAGDRHSTKGAIAGNGLLESGAIIHLGRRILIDAHAFSDWVRSKRGTTPATHSVSTRSGARTASELRRRASQNAKA